MIFATLFAFVWILNVQAHEVLIKRNESIVFLGDSIAFSGCANTDGFVNILTKALSSCVEMTLSCAARLDFSFATYLEGEIHNIFEHYKPSLAVLFVTDDEVGKVLQEWLQNDQRLRNEFVTCGDCLEYEENAKFMLNPLYRQLQHLISLIIQIDPKCRIILSTSIPGIYDTPVRLDLESAAYSEGYMRDIYIRNHLRVLMEQLSFDFSPSQLADNQTLSHYHGGVHQYSAFHIDVFDLGYALGRAREFIYKYESSTRLQPSVLAHGANGFSVRLDKASHAVIAYLFALFVKFDAETKSPSSNCSYGEFFLHVRKALDSALSHVDVGLNARQIESWRQDSAKSFLQRNHSRATNLQELRLRDYESRLQEERMYMEPVIPIAFKTPGKRSKNKFRREEL